jgi:esterase/lipase superfamily enzyme
MLASAGVICGGHLSEKLPDVPNFDTPVARHRQRRPIVVTFTRHAPISSEFYFHFLASRVLHRTRSQISASGAAARPMLMSFAMRRGSSALARVFPPRLPVANSGSARSVPAYVFEPYRAFVQCLGLFLILVLGGCVSMGVPDVSGTVASVGDVFASAPPGSPTIVPIFVASVRNGEHGAANEMSPDGTHYSLQMISVPPHHKVGEIERPAFGAPDPEQHFLVQSRSGYDETAFDNEIASHISGRIGSNRDILLYVHGFNTSYDEARFRLAQIVKDGRFGGVPVLYTWPSSDNLLGYEAARETATASRDGLSTLLRNLSNLPDVGRIHILAHSLGTWLTMEALREQAIEGHPDLKGKLGTVMLAAPDIDLSVFREQMRHLPPSHFVVLVSSKDKALSLSSWLAGDRPRLGALDPHRAADRAVLKRLGVRVYDLSPDSTGLIGHGMYADAPKVVRAIGQQIGRARLQDADVQAVLGKDPIDPKITTEPLPAAGASATAAAAAASATTTPAAAASQTTGAAAAAAQAAH